MHRRILGLAWENFMVLIFGRMANLDQKIGIIEGHSVVKVSKNLIFSHQVLL